MLEKQLLWHCKSCCPYTFLSPQGIWIHAVPWMSKWERRSSRSTWRTLEETSVGKKNVSEHLKCLLHCPRYLLFSSPSFPTLSLLCSLSLSPTWCLPLFFSHEGSPWPTPHLSCTCSYLSLIHLVMPKCIIFNPNSWILLFILFYFTFLPGFQLI